MSTSTVDEKVVRMRFDNSNFENNVKNTMSSLDKLKASLNFKGAADGLNDVSKAASKCDLSGLSKNVIETSNIFSSKFGFMEGFVERLGNRVADVALDIANMFMIQPISTGFSEYELKMGSVQTIMASTGATIDEVNGYLDELNAYADKTIYSFSDMTNNIGKFTNAGVSLDKAVSAIQGVSNVAAVSGANAAEASRAMYNFAQALSSGYVKLIDWKSIENANMATVEFKTQLMESAVAAGTLSKTTDGMYKTLEGNVLDATHDFNDSLTDQWMTTEVLVNTLSDYANEETEIGKKAFAAATEVKTFSMMMDTLMESAGSGWAKTWEIIVGDFEEAKSLFTSLTNFLDGIIQGISDTRNNFLEYILGGGKNTWGKLASMIESAGVSLDDFKNTLFEVGKENNVVTDEMIDAAGSFEKSLNSGWASSDIITKALDKMSKSETKFGKVTSSVTDKLEYFQKVVDSVWSGSYKNGQERIEALTEAGYDYYEVQNLVNQTVDGHRLTLEDLSGVELENIGYTQEEISKLHELMEQAKDTGSSFHSLISDIRYSDRVDGRTLLFKSLQNVLSGISKIINTVKGTFHEVFGNHVLGDAIYWLIEKFHDLTEGVNITEKTLGNLRSVFTGLFNSILLLKTLQSPFMKVVNTTKLYLERMFGVDFLSILARVGDVITSLYKNLTVSDTSIQILTASIGNFFEVIALWMDTIKDAFKNFFDSDGFQNILANIKKFFTSAYDIFRGEGSKLIGIIANFVKSLGDMGDDLSIDRFVDLMKDFGKNIREFITNLPDAFSKLASIIPDMIDNLNNASGKFLNVAKHILDEIVLFLKELWYNITKYITFAEIFAATASAGTVYVVGKLLKWLGVFTFSIAKFLKSLEEIPKAVVKLVGAVSGAFKQLTSTIKLVGVATTILMIAGSIYLLTKAMKEMAGIDPLALSASAFVVVAFLVAMVSVVKALSKLNVAASAASYGGLAMLGGIIAGIAVLVASIKVLSDIDAIDSGRALGEITVLLVLMVGVTAIMSRLEKGFSQNTVASFASLAGAIYTISLALKKIAAIDGRSSIRALGILTAMFIELGVMIAVTSVIGKNAVIQNAAIMVAIGSSLLMLSWAMKGLGSLDNSVITKAMMVIGGFMLMSGLLILATKVAGQYAAGAGVLIASMASSFIGIGVAVKILGSISPKTAKRAGEVMSHFIWVLGSVIAATFFAGPHAWQAGVTLLGLSAAVIAIAAALVIISHIDGDRLASATVALCFCIGALSVAIISARKVGDSGKTMAYLAATIATLAVSIAILSFIPTENLIKATIAMTVILIALKSVLTGLGTLGSSAKEIKQAGSAIALMAELIGLIVILVGSLYLLSSLNSDDTLKNAESIALVLGAMAAAVMIISHMDKAFGGVSIKSSLKTVVLLSGLIAVIISTLKLFSALGIQSPLETTGSLVLMLTGMVAVVGLMGVMAPLADAAAKSGPAFLKVAGVITAIIAAVSLITLGLDKLGGSGFTAKTLNEAVDVFTALGACLGAIVGGFVGGIAYGAVSYLPDVAKSIKQFAEIMAPAFDALKGLDAESVNKFDIAAKAVAVLGDSRGLSDPNNPFYSADTDKFKNLGENLITVAEGICGFNKQLVKGNLDADSISNAQKAAEMVDIIVEAIPKTGGVSDWVFGKQDFKIFGANLESFGESIVKYANSVNKLDESGLKAIERSKDTISPFIEIMQQMPEINGLAQGLAGGKNLKYLGDDLEAFGSSLISYNDALTSGEINFDWELIKSSATNMIEFINIMKEMPTNGGLASWLAGDKGLDNLGYGLASLGDGLTSYWTSISSISDFEAISSSTKTISELLTLMGAVSGENYDAKQDAIGTVSSIGTALKKYFSEVSGVNLSTVSESMPVVSELLSLPSNVKETSKDALMAFVSNLGDIGDALKTYYSGIADIDAEKASLAMNATKTAVDILSMISGITVSSEEIANFQNALNSLGTLSLDAFFSAFANCASGASEAALNLFSELIGAIEARTSSLNEAGMTIVNNIVAGIEASGTAISNGASFIFEQAKVTLNQYYSSFYSIGEYWSRGLGDGICSPDSVIYVRTASRVVAQAAIDEANKTLDERSPSHVMFSIGEYATMGLANGIVSLASLVRSSSESVADEAIMSMGSTMSTLNSMLEEDYFNDPVISPVMDLTDVISGADEIARLLSPSNIVGVSASGLASSILNGFGSGGNLNLVGNSAASVTNNHWDFGNAVLNDESAVANVTRNFLTELARIGVM